jgi:hypothetical protein
MPETAAPHPSTARIVPPPSRNGSAPPQPVPATPAAPPEPAVADPDQQPRTGLTTGAARSRITQLLQIMRRTFRRP